MKGKKLLSAFAALAMTVSAFAGLAVTADAATVVYESQWDSMDKTLDATTVTELGENWAFTTDGSTLSVKSGIVGIEETNGNNKDYLRYSFGTVAQCTGKIYRCSFDYKSNSGTNTGNNGSSMSAWITDGFTNYSQMGGGTTPVSLGATDTSTTYKISAIVDNINMKIVYEVNGAEKTTTSLTSVGRGFLFRTGKKKTDSISNFKVEELTIPSLTVDTTEKTIAPNTSASYDVSSEYSDANFKAESSDSAIATASYNTETKKIDIKGVAVGKTEITVTVTGTDAYETKSVIIPVTVKTDDTQAATISVKYVDYADTTKELKAATNVEGFVGVEYVATDEQKAEFEYTDKNGIAYTAVLNTQSVTSVTPESENAELVLKFDLTEKTHAVKITTAPYAKIVITGTPKSGGDSVNTTVYSDAAGVAELQMKIGDSYNAAVTKGGYTDSSTNALKVTINGTTANIELKPVSSLYYEDFNSAPSGNNWLTYSSDMTSAVETKNEASRVKFVNTKGNLRVGRKTLNITTSGHYMVDFDFELTKVDTAAAATRDQMISFRDANNNVMFGIAAKETAVGTDKYELYLYGGAVSNDNINTSDIGGNEVKLCDLTTSCVTSGHVSAVVDTVNKKATVKYGDYTQTVDLSTLENTSDVLSSIRVATQKSAVMFLDNLNVQNAPSIEVLDDAVKEATLTDQEVTPADGGTPITVNGTAYTVWYKLNNFAEGTQPTITLRNGDSTFNETATITQAEAGDNGYYCVQILGEGLDPSNYIITLTADGVSKDVAFTVYTGVDVPEIEI